jgi:hypothetical protein
LGAQLWSCTGYPDFFGSGRLVAPAAFAGFFLTAGLSTAFVFPVGNLLDGD